MATERHAQQDNRLARLIIMIVAAIAVLGIIAITIVALVGNGNGERLSAQSFINSIVQFETLETKEGAVNVLSADKCLNERGELVAYAVTAYGEGFAGRVSVRAFFEPNSSTLIGIQVTDQNENEKYGALSSQNYGADIADSTYVQRFEYAQMPVWFYDGSVPLENMPESEGTRVDTLTGATVSSRAVVQAVNAAYTYYTESVR